MTIQIATGVGGWLILEKRCDDVFLELDRLEISRASVTGEDDFDHR